MLTDFKHQSHRVISAEVLEALKAVGDRYGIDFSTNGGEIGSVGGMIKLRVNLRQAAVAAGAFRAENEFRVVASFYGLDPDSFGTVFVYRGDRYRISCINTRAPKMPVQAECLSNGRSYKFSPATVLASTLKKAA